MATQILPREIASLERFIDPKLLDMTKLDLTIEADNSEKLHTFIARKLKWYIENNYFGGRLWEDYQDDFEDWTEDMLRKCEKEVIHCLRDTLVRRGVFVPRGSDRRKITTKLFNIIKEEVLHHWTPEEVQAQIDHGGGFVGGYRPPTSQNRTPYINPNPMPKREIDPASQFKNLAIEQKDLKPILQTSQSYSAPDKSLSGPDLEDFSTMEYPKYAKLQDFARSKTTENIIPEISGQQQEGVKLSRLVDNVSDGISKKLADLGKLYFDREAKYSGESHDILDTKLTIFRDYCRKVGLSKENYSSAFSFMLKGDAAEYYYQHISEKVEDFDSMIRMLKGQFETEQIKMEYLTKWRNTTLLFIKQNHPDKKLSECFQLMVSELQKIQRRLHSSYQTDQTIRDQVLNGCQGIPECKMALYNPAPNFEGVVAQIRNALYTEEQQLIIHNHFVSNNYKIADVENQYYTERKYRGKREFGDSGSRGFNGHDRYQAHGKNRSNKPSGRPKRCYICNKPGCWSTSHSPSERREAFEKFSKASYFQNHPATISKYQSFLAEWEGVEGMAEFYDDEISQVLFQMDDSGGLGSNDGERENQESEGFFTEFGVADPYELLNILTNQSVFHMITGEDIFKGQKQLSKASPEKETKSEILPRYSSSEFQGIIPDTGAAGVSTAGHPQVIALQRLRSSLKIDESRAGEHNIRFGKGEALSLGTIEVDTPIGKIVFHVVPTYTPFLLCLQDMKNLGVYLDNLENVLVQGLNRVPIIIKFGHPWMLLHRKEQSIAYCNLTETELRQLHRRFGHPSVNRLVELLRKAGHDVQNKVVEKINHHCRQCQLHGKSPGRFKFKLPEEHNFNHSVIVDIFNLDGLNVLHTIDEATNYQAAKFLTNMTASAVWDSFRACWIDVYLGPPDFVIHDAGTNFSSKLFRQSAKLMGIEVQEVPVEAHNSIGKVERYHGPLRRAYQILCAELKDKGLSKEYMLQMAVKAINDSAGPHGLIPTLLVYGAYPRITKDSAPSPSLIERAQAIEKAMKEIAKIRAERYVKDALTTRNGPNTFPIMNIPLNSEVLVWRENKNWNGPYKLISTDADHQECVVQLPHGPTKFRSTLVKPLNKDENNLDEDSDEESESDSLSPDLISIDNYIPPSKTNEPLKRGKGRPKGSKNRPKQFFAIDIEAHENDDSPQKKIAYSYDESYISAKEEADLELSKKLRLEGVIKTSGKPFEIADFTEFDSLIKNGVVKLEKFDEEKFGNVRLFNSRLVREVKGKGTNNPYEKSRLVIAAWEDEGKSEILTQSPTLQRASQRLLVAIAPSLLKLTTKDSKNDDDKCKNSIPIKMGVWLRDISQAYTQSTSVLSRLFCAKIPKQFRNLYPKDTIMVVLKPLYGIPEAGTHWWATYMEHHKTELDMQVSTFDPCLLITKGDIFGLVGMQTDDTLIVGEESFSSKEEEKLKFVAKPKLKLSITTPLLYNGCAINLNEDCSIEMRQKGQGRKIMQVDTNLSKQSHFVDGSIAKDYVQQRARGAYIASICQPEASYDLSVAAQSQNPNNDEITKLNKRLEWQKNNLDRGLKNIPLDLKSLKLFIFVDGSFANNVDLSSQIGYVIVLANEARYEEHKFSIIGNIVHYSSTKSKRVTRSVLASEIYAMVGGVDVGYAISTTINLILSQLGMSFIPLVVCTDSYSLYECLVKLGTTKEKRLMIDIMALRQSYERRELYEIRWINGLDNPADAMTKRHPNNALKNLIDDNRLEVRIEGWVKRD